MLSGRVATAHNQEPGTKNQEQPRSGYIPHHSSEILHQPAQGQRPLTTKNEEPGTKNSREAANFNLNCHGVAYFNCREAAS